MFTAAMAGIKKAAAAVSTTVASTATAVNNALGGRPQKMANQIAASGTYQAGRNLAGRVFRSKVARNTAIAVAGTAAVATGAVGGLKYLPVGSSDAQLHRASAPPVATTDKANPAGTASATPPANTKGTAKPDKRSRAELKSQTYNIVSQTVAFNGRSEGYGNALNSTAKPGGTSLG
jgi:hypothetical protein